MVPVGLLRNVNELWESDMSGEKFPENKNLRGVIHAMLAIVAVLSLVGMLSESFRLPAVIAFFSCWAIFLLDLMANYLRVIANHTEKKRGEPSGGPSRES